MNGDSKNISLALVCLLVLVMWALYLGHNGAVLASAIAIFGYIIGYKHRTKRAPTIGEKVQTHHT